MAKNGENNKAYYDPKILCQQAEVITTNIKSTINCSLLKRKK
jgi:hypothetical protein